MTAIVEETLDDMEQREVFSEEQVQMFLKFCILLHIIGCSVVGRAIYLERKQAQIEMGEYNDGKLGEYEDDIDFEPLNGKVMDEKLTISDVYVDLEDHETN